MPPATRSGNGTCVWVRGGPESLTSFCGVDLVVALRTDVSSEIRSSSLLHKSKKDLSGSGSSPIVFALCVSRCSRLFGHLGESTQCWAFSTLLLLQSTPQRGVEDSSPCSHCSEVEGRMVSMRATMGCRTAWRTLGLGTSTIARETSCKAANLKRSSHRISLLLLSTL